MATREAHRPKQTKQAGAQAIANIRGRIVHALATHNAFIASARAQAELLEAQAAFLLKALQKCDALLAPVGRAKREGADEDLARIEIAELLDVQIRGLGYRGT